MSFIEDNPRFATIRALEPTRLLEFSEQNLRSVLLRQPQLLYGMVQELSARLRRADMQMIADLQRKNRDLTQAYRELQEAQAALVEKERLECELELARELQQSILPHEFPDLKEFSFAARSRPARQVGGDFYDVIPLSGGRVGLIMADVSDKGMSAALYMALTRSLIHAEAKRSSSPRKVLLSVHRLLLDMSQADMFVTVFYGVLDPAQSNLRYARAGHDRPLLFSPTTGEWRFLTGKGTVLGFVEEVSLEEVGVDLRPGDLLIFYTDGITDANSPAGEFFGSERLRKTVCAAGGLGADDMCDHIFEHVDQFQTGAVQHDDMALLVVKKANAGR
jgi:serine phosphatase RsbU (regulator of sigma subunit)